MELKKRNLSDNGIRLKPNKPNLLENYSKVRKRTRKKKKKKKEKSKTIEIQKKVDPIDKLIQNLNRKETKIEDIEIKDKKDKKDIKIEEINNQVEENKNIKKLTITASTKPHKKKTGGGFVIE